MFKFKRVFLFIIIIQTTFIALDFDALEKKTVKKSTIKIDASDSIKQGEKLLEKTQKKRLKYLSEKRKQELKNKKSLSKCERLNKKCLSFCKYKSDNSSLLGTSPKDACKYSCIDSLRYCKTNDISGWIVSTCNAICKGNSHDTGMLPFSSSDYTNCVNDCSVNISMDNFMHLK